MVASCKQRLHRPSERVVFPSISEPFLGRTAIICNSAKHPLPTIKGLKYPGHSRATILPCDMMCDREK